jgi:VIT1/CCC1 family predicted Fe2+/Mn2+ transporter
MKNTTDDELLAEHSDSAIAKRLDQRFLHGTLGDVVLGGVDGTITTFAIVSGVAGVGLEKGALIAFVLGLANVLADGFSMGISNYLKACSDLQTVERFREIEEEHIQRVPEFEKEEVRQIYARKGFSGELLEQITNVITSDKKIWIDTMLTEEWGLQIVPTSPVRSGFITFSSFIAAGLIPLMPLLLAFGETIAEGDIFIYCACLTACTFVLLGAIRGKVLGGSMVKSSIETLCMGAVAAALAYFVGEVLGRLIL